MFKKLIKFNLYLFATLAIRKALNQLIVGYYYGKLMREQSKADDPKAEQTFNAFNSIGVTDLELSYALLKSDSKEAVK